MEVPFIYGKIAIGKDFCDREKETTYLVQYFTSFNQYNYYLPSWLG